MRIKQGFELRRVGNEEIVVAGGIENIDFSSIISMNSSSAWLWKQLQDVEFTTDTIKDLLLNYYNIDSTTAQNDAKDIVKQWLDSEIITE